MDINGSAVNSIHDVRDAISPHKQGDTISLKVQHGDTQKTLSVALGEKDGHVYIGAMLFPDEHERTGMGTNQMWPSALSEGAIVAKVSPGGPADKAGIKKGNVILSVDGVQVDANHSLSSLIQDKKIGDTVTLSVWSGGTSMDKAPQDVKVTLGSTPDKMKPWLGVEYRMGLPAAFLNPWSNFPPLADIHAPDFGWTLPHIPALPDVRMPSATAPVI